MQALPRVKASQTLAGFLIHYNRDGCAENHLSFSRGQNPLTSIDPSVQTPWCPHKIPIVRSHA